MLVLGMKWFLQEQIKGSIIKAQHETKPVSQGMKLLYKGMKKIKKISGSEKVISQSMKLLYKGMKKVKFFLGSEKVVHKV